MCWTCSVNNACAEHLLYDMEIFITAYCICTMYMYMYMYCSVVCSLCVLQYIHVHVHVYTCLYALYYVSRQCRGSSVYLLEVSLDCSLANAALHIEVRDRSTVLPDVTVQEIEGSSVVVLFATSSCVFRLLLPHPETINKVRICIHYVQT